jgi:hypothetical protein
MEAKFVTLNCFPPYWPAVRVVINYIDNNLHCCR